MRTRAIPLLALAVTLGPAAWCRGQIFTPTEVGGVKLMNRKAIALVKLPVLERAKAVEALGRPGPDGEAAVPALIELLQCPDDRDLVVYDAAVGALGRIGKAAVPSLLEALKGRNGEEKVLLYGGAHLALAKMGPDVLPTLLGRLADRGEDEGLRRGAILAIEEMKPPARPAIPALIRVLVEEKDNLALRERAARCLGAMGPDAAEAVPALVDVLREPPDADEAAMLRDEAKTALSRIGPASAPALRKLIASSRGVARYLGVRALLGSGPEGEREAIPMLVELLDDPDLRVESGGQHLVDVLSLLGSHRSRPDLTVPALTRAVRDPDETLRGFAAFSLGEYGPAAAPAIDGLVRLLADSGGHPQSENGNIAANALGSIGPAAVPAVIATMKAPDAYTRMMAAYALLEMKPVAKVIEAGAVPPLIEAARDEDGSVREAAARVLGALRAADGVPALVALMDRDRDAQAGIEAAHALAQIGLPAAAPALPKLKAAATEPGHPLRNISLQALAVLGPDARTNVIAALEDRDPDVRTVAAAALGEAGPAAADALPALHSHLDDPSPEVREAVAAAVSSITRPGAKEAGPAAPANPPE